MTPTTFRFALLLAAPLALAACGGGGKKEKDQRTAVGEVLPGSISDSMLPYDAVRSQPPFAPKETGKADAKGDDAGPDEPDAASAEEAPAAAATTPEASESPAE